MNAPARGVRSRCRTGCLPAAVRPSPCCTPMASRPGSYRALAAHLAPWGEVRGL